MVVQAKAHSQRHSHTSVKDWHKPNREYGVIFFKYPRNLVIYGYWKIGKMCICIGFLCRKQQMLEGRTLYQCFSSIKIQMPFHWWVSGTLIRLSSLHSFLITLNRQWATAFRWFTAIRDSGGAWHEGTQLRPHLFKPRCPDFLPQRRMFPYRKRFPGSPLSPCGRGFLWNC